MDNSTTSPLQGEALLGNQLELITPTTVAGTLYGIAFSLFCLYVHALTAQLRDGDRKRQAKFTLGCSTVIMLCGLYSLAFNAWLIQDAFIKHSDYRGGPFSHISSTFLSNPAIFVAFACQTAVDILTSATQVWRVWVVWSATRYAGLVAVLPTLCFLTFSALQLRTIILRSTLPIAEVLWLDAKTGLVAIALQGATTILCTLLISIYLIFRQWQQRKLIGKSQGFTGYMSVVAMIVESYVLESIWLLAIAILQGRGVAAEDFFTESVNCIEIIAYLLVQYRVASGKSYESHRGRPNISSLRWNHSDRATAELGGAGESMSAIPEASNTSRVSTMT